MSGVSRHSYHAIIAHEKSSDVHKLYSQADLLHGDISIFNMAYYMEGSKHIGVLIDFDMATYPEEIGLKVLGSLQDGDKAGEVTAHAGMTSLNPFPTADRQGRFGTKAFMAIETLDLNTLDYKHHLSHDLESIFYASVWHGVGYKYDQIQYPMVLMYTDGKEKEVDLLRSWRVGPWDAVVKEKENFLGAPDATLCYIKYATLEATCLNLAYLFHTRRDAAKEAAQESIRLEKCANFYQKLISGGIGGGSDSDDEDWVKDPLVLARWAARAGLNAPEDISKPLDPIYPEYAGYWFLSDLDDCEKSCCRPV